METCSGNCSACLQSMCIWNCAFCRMEYSESVHGFWCSEECWKLNQVLSGDDFRNNIIPPRERVEMMYGKDTPQFQY